MAKIGSKYGVPCYVGGKYNPEYGRAYRAANRDKVREHYRNYLKRNPGRDHRVREYRIMAVNLIFERDGGICGVCGNPVERFQASIDHITQVAAGGSHESSNLRLTHLRCNLTRPKWNHRAGRTCSIVGCDGKHRALGLCNKHYLRKQWQDRKSR